MRETLGLSGNGRSQARAQIRSSQPSAAAKPRHRFVQDGEVPVIHLTTGNRDGDPGSASRTRIAALEAQLETEQAARNRAEQSLTSSMAQIHALETKLAHVEMAAQEIIAAERGARERVEAELTTANAARELAQNALHDLLSRQPREAAPPQPMLDFAEPGADMAAPPTRKPRAKSTTPRVAKPKLPRSTTPRVKEPKPVKWWLASSKTKFSKG